MREARRRAGHRAQVEFSLGESVKVTSGPLRLRRRDRRRQRGRQKLKVLVDIFERQVVELAFDQVKKID
jgi:transcription antitermination factor NusG